MHSYFKIQIMIFKLCFSRTIHIFEITRKISIRENVIKITQNLTFNIPFLHILYVSKKMNYLFCHLYLYCISLNIIHFSGIHFPLLLFHTILFDTIRTFFMQSSSWISHFSNFFQDSCNSRNFKQFFCIQCEMLIFILQKYFNLMIKTKKNPKDRDHMIHIIF